MELNFQLLLIGVFEFFVQLSCSMYVYIRSTPVHPTVIQNTTKWNNGERRERGLVLLAPDSKRKVL